MSGLQDKSVSNEPWRPIPPQSPLAIPDDAVIQGGFHWWIRGEVPNLQVMCAGGDGGPHVVGNSEYPDEIWDRLKTLDPTLK